MFGGLKRGSKPKRALILEILRREGELSLHGVVDRYMALLEITDTYPNKNRTLGTVRHHLDSLLAAGLVNLRFEKRGGKTVSGYSLAQAVTIDGRVLRRFKTALERKRSAEEAETQETETEKAEKQDI